MIRKKAEAANFIDNLYKIGRYFRDAEKRPRYYGTDILMYPNEAYTLKAIVESEGINQKELSEQMVRTKGATSVVVKKLIQKGLVISKSESMDLRIGSLYPTEKGMQVYKAHRKYDEEYIDLVSNHANLTREDMEKLNEMLETLMNVIKERPGEVHNFK